jgi:hypothetical protein
VQKIE